MPSCGNPLDLCASYTNDACEPEPQKYPDLGEPPDDGGATACDDGTNNAGDDPIDLRSRAAVSAPFTDFAAEGVVRIAFTRTYSSADSSVRLGTAPGVFGRGWHHDWEYELSCRQWNAGYSVATECRVSRGLAASMAFGRGPYSATGLGAYQGESWLVFYRSDIDESGTGDRGVLVQRPADASGNPRWIVFASDGRELHFATVCDCGTTDTVYCSSAMPAAPTQGYPSQTTGGRARLVKVLDPRGNAVGISYDRPSGRFLSLQDELGHRLDLKGSGNACSGSRVTTLEYGPDGATTVYASYAYTGDQLAAVRLGNGSGALLRSYEYDPARVGFLKTIRNAGGDPVAEFGYDTNGYATSLADRSSTLAVAYPDLQTDTISVATASSWSTKTQTRGARHTLGSEAFNWSPYAAYYAWVSRYLRCREDEEHRVHWYDRDGNGRITRHAQYAAGDFSCLSQGPTRAGVTPVVEEWFDYGLEKQIAIAGGAPLIVPLTAVTRTYRQSALAGQVSSGDKTTFDRVYDYDPHYAATKGDPAGYTCTPQPDSTPAGSVPCRYVEDGLTTDIDGNVVREQRTTYFSYDARGRLTRTIGPLLATAGPDSSTPVEERTYWSDTESPWRRGRLHEVKRYPGGAAPHVTTLDWDTFGPYQITDSNGLTTLVVHDGRGRVVARSTPDGQALSVRYYDERWPRVVLRSGGGAWRFAYDNRGRVIRVDALSGDPDAGGAAQLGASQAIGYDPAGNASVVTLAGDDGVVRWKRLREYDSDHRLLSETHPEDPTRVALWSYDHAGMLSSITDEEGRITEFLPDGIGRPQTVRRRGRDERSSDVSLDMAAYAFEDEGDALRSVTDGSGRTTEYVHSDFGEVLSVGGSSTLRSTPWRYAHDPRGNVTQRKGGQVTTAYAYDALRRLTRLVATSAYDGEQIIYEYHYDEGDLGMGRLSSIVEAGRSTDFTYDQVGRVRTETVRENGGTGAFTPLATEYRYDPDGDVSTIVYPSGLTIDLERDPATKSVRSVRNARTGLAYASGVAYWPGGPLRSLNFGNGATLTQAFNLRYEPSTIQSGPLSLAFAMTPAGDIASIASGSSTTTFTHDFIDRLVSFTPGYGAGETPPMRYEYSGDRVTAAYVSGSPEVRRYAFGYDDQTNLSAVSLYDATGTTITQTLCLKHDALGRVVLVGWTTPGNGGPDRLVCRSEAEIATVLTRFQYDARNRRVARYTAATGAWTQFAFLPDGSHLAELGRPPSTAGAWTPIRDYVWLGRTPLVQVEYTGAAGAYYFHVDHLGLPRLMTDASGQVAWRADARPYGDVLEQSGATVVTNLRLPGQYDERLFAAAGISGLQGPYYNWNRWYLPSMGRYMELDPIALRGKFNARFGPDWYGYAVQSPLRFKDPRGLDIYGIGFSGGGEAIFGGDGGVLVASDGYGNVAVNFGVNGRAGPALGISFGPYGLYVPGVDTLEDYINYSSPLSLNVAALSLGGGSASVMMVPQVCGKADKPYSERTYAYTYSPPFGPKYLLEAGVYLSGGVSGWVWVMRNGQLIAQPDDAVPPLWGIGP